MVNSAPKIKDAVRQVVTTKHRTERRDEYKMYFFQVQNMMTQNTIEADKALGTFAIAALAALAALNERVFGPYGKLSFVTLTCFLIVILLVTIGYVVSNKLLSDAQEKLTANFLKSSSTPLGEGTEKPKFARLSRGINYASMALFSIGMVLFIILLYQYIRKVK